MGAAEVEEGVEDEKREGRAEVEAVEEGAVMLHQKEDSTSLALRRIRGKSCLRRERGRRRGLGMPLVSGQADQGSQLGHDDKL